MKGRNQFPEKVLKIIAIPIGVFGLVCALLIVYYKIKTGRSLEAFITAEGIETNYISAAIFLGLIFVIIIMASLMRIRSNRFKKGGGRGISH